MMSAAEVYDTQTGVIEELREQNARLERMLEFRGRRIASLAARHRALAEVARDAHDELVKAGFEECDKCLGTGGVPLDLEDQWTNEDGELCGVVTRWTSPRDQACEELSLIHI